MPPYPAIEEIVREAVRTQNAAIEEACERMLVCPVLVGVLVETWEDGWRVSLTREPPYEPMMVNYQYRVGKRPTLPPR